MRMATTNIKEEARKLIEKMPDDSTWDDLMHKIYVRQAIESGLADSQAGRTTSVETLRAEFGLENHLITSSLIRSTSLRSSMAHSKFPPANNNG